MGRLKKDHSNWRTMGLWKKYQHPNVYETPKRVKRSKNTKRWCKGKVGREHDYKLKQTEDWQMMPICSKCKKQDYSGVLYKCNKTGEFEKSHFCWFNKC